MNPEMVSGFYDIEREIEKSKPSVVVDAPKIPFSVVPRHVQDLYKTANR